MKELWTVLIEDAPGYENFYGYEYDRFKAVDDRGDLSIIIDHYSEIIIVPSRCVTYITD
jgi:hypothetical protein